MLFECRPYGACGHRRQGCGACPTAAFLLTNYNAMQTKSLKKAVDGGTAAPMVAVGRLYRLRRRQPRYSPRLARAHLVVGKDPPAQLIGLAHRRDGTAALEVELRLVPAKSHVVAGLPTPARLGAKRPPSVASSIVKLPPSFQITETGSKEPSRPKRATTSTYSRCTRRRVPSVSVRYSMPRG